MPPTSVDTLIHARWVIPVEPQGTALQNHTVIVDRGKIVALMPSTETEQHYDAREEVHLANHAVIPGLINAHTHAAMTLLRGYADDRPLMDWLHNYIWPAELKWASPEFVRDGTLLAIAEMLRGGVTCFSDMYFFPDEVAHAAASAGMRATVGLIVIEFPSPWAADAADYLRKGIDVHDQLRHHPLVRTAFAPHAPYTVSNSTFGKLATYASELNIPIHMHVHETAEEVRTALAQTGERPLKRLERLGLLTPQLLAVHMTQLEPHEITTVAAQGVHVLHCPESNLKLASGFCPVARLMQAGVNVAIGTDGAASNNNLDMFGEMRAAALLAKAVAGDASAIPAALALQMATLNGARALGIDDIAGSLAPGKAADLVAVDLHYPATQPVYDPISAIIYSADRDLVTDVWVQGRRLLADRALTTLDESEILMRAQHWGERLSAR